MVSWAASSGPVRRGRRLAVPERLAAARPRPLRPPALDPSRAWSGAQTGPSALPLVARRRRDGPLAQPGLAQLVRTDVAAEDGQSGQVSGGPERRGTAVGQHDRPDAEV